MKFIQKSLNTNDIDETKMNTKLDITPNGSTVKIFDSFANSGVTFSGSSISLSGILKEDGLLKGIIMAEILGAPKCKQRGSNKGVRRNRFKC